MAVPFSFYLPNAGEAMKAIDIGVIALHSTNFCTERDGTTWSDRRRRSILSALTDDQSRQLSEALADIGTKIVTTPG